MPAIGAEFSLGPGHTCSESLWNMSGSHLTAGKIMHESDQLTETSFISNNVKKYRYEKLTTFSAPSQFNLHAFCDYKLLFNNAYLYHCTVDDKQYMPKFKVP